MKEIDILRFRCDYEIILSTIKEILKERNQKLENITFKFEKTTLGEEVEVHGYEPNEQVRCRIFIKYEDLIDAIFILARNVSKVSEGIYDNDIVYERPAGRVDYRFSLD